VVIFSHIVGVLGIHPHRGGEEKKAKKKNKRRKQTDKKKVAEGSYGTPQERFLDVVKNFGRKVMKMRHFGQAYNQLQRSGILSAFTHSTHSGGRHNTLHGPGLAPLKMITSVKGDVNASQVKRRLL
jgi:hypothetical protein